MCCFHPSAATGTERNFPAISLRTIYPSMEILATLLLHKNSEIYPAKERIKFAIVERARCEAEVFSVPRGKWRRASGDRPMARNPKCNAIARQRE